MSSIDLKSLTKEQLREIEQKPKSKLSKILDKVILFLPVFSIILALLEYYYVPNYGNNLITDVYGIFLGAQLIIFLVLGILSFFIKRVYYRIRHIAPFATFVYILLMIYDYATLKTNSLLLPYFPWVDNILNAMLTDQAYLLDCIKNSLKLLFTGYFWGVLIGLITGIACGYSKIVSYWISPFMKLLGAIPSITWIPVIMVFASSLFKGAVIVIALGVWFSVTMSSYTGIKNIDVSRREATIVVDCSKGTYIRTLCKDIGNELGCKAAMKSLLRTKTGDFLLENSYKLDEIEKLVKENRVSEIIIPIEDVFKNLQRVDVSGYAGILLENGGIIKVDAVKPDIEALKPKNGEKFRMYNDKGEFKAVYSYNGDINAFKIDKMF